MPWPLRHATRELRGAGRHFAYLAACVSLGVAALVAVGSLGHSVERTVAASGKSLMGADVEIRSSQPLSPQAEAALATLGRDGARGVRVRELAAMAQPASGAGDRVLLVELKAVGEAYPLYGRLETVPAAALADLIGGGRALVQEAVLTRLGLAVGDSLRVGDADLRIAGIIKSEPDRAVGFFSLGPRVLVADSDLLATGLVRPGSRVRHRALLRLPEGADVEATRDALAARLTDGGLRVTTYRQAQPGLRRFWDQLTTYLGLTGLVALLVGGIGVAVSVRALLRRRIATIATLKCLGAPWPRIFAAYLLQTVGLGLVGSLAGALMGAGLARVLAPALNRMLPFPLDWTVSPASVLHGIAMGVGVTLLCALPPLAEIRRVPAAFLLRREVEARPPGWRTWLAALPAAAGLAALALWQAGSWKVGGLFIGGFAGGLVLLYLAARLTLSGVRRLPRAPWLAWRHGLANLHRPGGHAAAVLVTLGLAVMLVVAVALLEGGIRAALSGPSVAKAPAFFFIDIQPDQASAFARLVTEGAGAAPTLVPVVRARLAAVDGAPIARDAGRRDEAWFLTREYVLTWAAAPPERDVVTAGRWWTAAEAAREPLVSVEEEIAKNLGVGVGGTLTWDIQGVPVTARVTSLRKVDWRTFGANFFVIFSPGALEGAPSTFIATAQVAPADADRLQAAVVAAFPNVSAIPVREVLERAAALVDQIALAVRLVAAVSILAGLIVLAGALSITRHERLYQSVIWKALGATRGLVARSFAVEYALLGAAAGLAGTALAAALAWGVQRWLLEVPWLWQPAALTAGVVGATLLALAVGYLGSYRLLGQKPLAVLRGE
jgi:putative ABC transport system permease protein